MVGTTIIHFVKIARFLIIGAIITASQPSSLPFNRGAGFLE
jgi:hypothetical protein